MPHKTILRESISVFDIFKIGIGPSSSHTMGPWRAAQAFTRQCLAKGFSPHVEAVQVELFGSLAKTGKGHGTDLAILMGLHGFDPATCPLSEVEKFNALRSKPLTQIVFNKSTTLPHHPNALTFSVVHEGKRFSETYYSVGGGFVVQEHEAMAENRATPLPFPIQEGKELLHYCKARALSIPEVVLTNERCWRTDATIYAQLDTLYHAMIDCVHRGTLAQGELPGGLQVVRRAGAIARGLLGKEPPASIDAWLKAVKRGGESFDLVLRWVTCFALAVNEENAAFGRVVTAPTNGSAGVIPAVLLYLVLFRGGDTKDIHDFLLTAGEMGSIFKKGATISAAMGGCQAEIGVSSAMAAAGLTQCLGGSPEQVLMAAEIAMEHHLGLTCDPVGGLVQIPCIERNTMGAIKAITASSIALESDPESAKVSLDAIIKTLWDTALDMSTRYKETSEAGLALQIAVNVSEC